MEEKLLDMGAKLVGTIGKKTDCVVAGENAGPAKLERCRQLKIRVLSEKDVQHIATLLQE